MLSSFVSVLFPPLRDVEGQRQRRQTKAGCENDILKAENAFRCDKVFCFSFIILLKNTQITSCNITELNLTWMKELRENKGEEVGVDGGVGGKLFYFVSFQHSVGYSYTCGVISTSIFQ